MQSVKRQREYLGYRTSAPEPASSGSSMPTLIGAAMIAAAILLSTLISSLGSRYVGFERAFEPDVQRLPSELISVDSRIAAAIMAAPISVGIELPELAGSGALVR